MYDMMPAPEAPSQQVPTAANPGAVPPEPFHPLDQPLKLLVAVSKQASEQAKMFDEDLAQMLEDIGSKVNRERLKLQKEVEQAKELLQGLSLTQQ